MTLAESLGLAPDARIAVIHVDDVGMCHGANKAYLDLFRSGGVTTGAVMVPCPWFMEIAEAAAADRTLDLGVHLTLTAEWPHYRWRPISTSSKASGLLDDDGYLPRNCLELRKRLVPEAAGIEMRAQVERALAADIDATHIDTHMGAAFIPELFPIYLAIGREYDLPVLLPRDLDSYLGVLKIGDVDRDAVEKAVAAADALGVPVVDRFRMTPFGTSEDTETAYRRLLTGDRTGLTYVALHCNAPGDIEIIVPPRAHWRTDEYRLFGSGQTQQWLQEAGITTIGYRPLRNLYRRRTSKY